MYPHIKAVQIRGYRPFGDFRASLKSLEVIVGANGSGKSSLFEFLRFLRDATYQEIPAEIVQGTIGQEIFHRPGPDRFSWAITFDMGQISGLVFSGELIGPIGNTRIAWEKVETERPLPGHSSPLILLDVRGSVGKIYNSDERKLARLEESVELRRPNQLTLGTNISPKFNALHELRDYLQGWRFYSAFNIDYAAIRRATIIEEKPTLREDSRNLAAVLHFLYTEHPSVFEEIQTHLRYSVPGFRNLSIKSQGGPGHVMVFWHESGTQDKLSLADASDGSLRLLSWITLALSPEPPPLICIDEPDQGIHPRALPKLAGLFEKLAGRTQVLLATHSSYFLTQFDIAQIAVMRKEAGEARFLKPSDSAILMANLADFGVEEIEAMHKNDELEKFA